MVLNDLDQFCALDVSGWSSSNALSWQSESSLSSNFIYVFFNSQMCGGVSVFSTAIFTMDATFVISCLLFRAAWPSALEKGVCI